MDRLKYRTATRSTSTFLFLIILYSTAAAPEGRRNRDHIDAVLNQKEQEMLTFKAEQYLRALKAINKNKIQPLAEAFKFRDMGHHHLSDGELEAKPMVLFLGPWSAGKTTMINYLLGLEDHEALLVGAEPKTTDFTVLYHGKHHQKVNGNVLVANKRQPYGSLEPYGNTFLEHFKGIEHPHKLLEKVTIVDTPGIIENRKQQERGYPYNEVCEWFMERSDLIFVVFDPTKLAIGFELESVFKQFEGHESQVRLILNKADSNSKQELMRVYGALFWSLGSLVQVPEPPRVYVGSFWDKPFAPNTFQDLFLEEEMSLLMDITEAIVNQVTNKIAKVRQRAKAVRTHALLVDEYRKAFTENCPMLSNGRELMRDIVTFPQKFNIYKRVLASPQMSKYDLPHPSKYMEFFAIHDVDSLKPLSCGWFFSGCSLDDIDQAIEDDLPRLLSNVEALIQEGECSIDGSCSSKDKEKVKYTPIDNN